MILYICDRRRCEHCNDDCYLTKDIEHAVMFYKDKQGNFIERITIPKAIHNDKQLTQIMIDELAEANR